MHFGHTYNNYGPLDYLDVWYKSNGISVGKKDPPIIGYGALASAPVASAENQNMFYMSTDFGLCFSRSVAHLRGNDYIENPLLTSDMKSTDWEIEFVMRDGGATQTTVSDILRFYNEFGHFPILLYLSNTNKLSLEIRNGATYVTAVMIPTSPTFNEFFKVNLKKVGGTISLTALGNTISITNLSGWNAQTIIYSRFEDTNSDIRPLSVCNVKQFLSGSQIDCFQCNEASGTIIANQCNPSHPATIIDSTAHAYSWVPWSLLQ